MDLNERVGTVQRTQVLDLLSQALEQGYIDLADYERRMSLVHTATVVGDLTSQVADLPRQFHWHPQQAQMAPVTPTVGVDPEKRIRTMTLASVSLGGVALVTSICGGVGALFGVAAILLGRPGLKSARNHGLALTGIILGAVGIVFSLCAVGILIFGDGVQPPA
ncbi:hypothetical protein AWW66_19405 [Micromonospora rosaria]|uniref:DUF1707 domain-containing protein n=2 Tax=Micromonospora TaxID=1873 RepID=A0A136PPJ4_9ACTN|nr:DUF1707 and DUF4190 domain-containing protein [Micromonospora rosaria]KXK60342.1 hypothetical protein AWW66_19405 [Micromonospora rosaria]